VLRRNSAAGTRLQVRGDGAEGIVVVIGVLKRRSIRCRHRLLLMLDDEATQQGFMGSGTIRTAPV